MKKTKNNRNFSFALPLILVGLFTASCEKDPTEPSDTGGLLFSENYDGIVDIEYTPETVTIDNNGGNAVISNDTATGTIVLHRASLGSNIPKAGNTLLVPGEIMRKVTSVSNRGGNLIVETQDAVLTDVIKNGTIAWDFTPQITGGSQFAIRNPETNRVMRIPFYAQNQNEIKFPVKVEMGVGAITYEFEFDGKKDGSEISEISLQVLIKKQYNKVINGTVSAKGTFKIPKSRARFDIAGGVITGASVENDNIVCDIDVAASLAGEGLSDDVKAAFPKVAIEIPIRYIPTPTGAVIPNPIPMSISIGIGTVLRMNNYDPNGSATMKAKFDYSGKTGFTFKGVEPEFKFAPPSQNMTPQPADAAANIGVPVDFQVGLALPLIGLNIAGKELCAIYSAYYMGVRLSWGPICKRAYTKIATQVQWNFAVLGLSFIKGEKSLTEAEKEGKGDSCP